MIPFENLDAWQQGDILEDSIREAERLNGFSCPEHHINSPGTDIIATKYGYTECIEVQNWAPTSTFTDARINSIIHNLNSCSTKYKFVIISYDCFTKRQRSKIEQAGIRILILGYQMKAKTDKGIQDIRQLLRRIGCYNTISSLRDCVHHFVEHACISFIPSNIDSNNHHSFVTFIDSMAILGRLKTLRLTKFLQTLCIMPNSSVESLNFLSRLKSLGKKFSLQKFSSRIMTCLKWSDVN